MASFLDRAFDLPTTTNDFSTDDEGRSFEGAVDRSARRHRLRLGATTYCRSGAIAGHGVSSTKLFAYEADALRGLETSRLAAAKRPCVAPAGASRRPATYPPVPLGGRFGKSG